MAMDKYGRRRTKLNICSALYKYIDEFSKELDHALPSAKSWGGFNKCGSLLQEGWGRSCGPGGRVYGRSPWGLNGGCNSVTPVIGWCWASLSRISSGTSCWASLTPTVCRRMARYRARASGDGSSASESELTNSSNWNRKAIDTFKGILTLQMSVEALYWQPGVATNTCLIVLYNQISSPCLFDIADNNNDWETNYRVHPNRSAVCKCKGLRAHLIISIINHACQYL